MGIVHYLRDGMTGLVNRMTGLGTSRDPMAHNQYVFSRPSTSQLEAIYRSNWIARKIVNIPVEDMLRQGWSWTADDPLITALEEEEKRLNLKETLRRALIRDAIYGGAGIFIGTADGDLSTELRADRMGKSSIAYLTPFHSEDLQVEELSRDPDRLGQPVMFTIHRDQSAVPLRIHPSRVIPFRGRPVDKAVARMTKDDWWGDSRLANVLTDIAGASTALTGGARLMGELAIWKFKINGLAETLTTAGGEEQIQKLLTMTTTLKSSLNAVAVDGNDDVDVVTASTAGIADSIRAFMQNVAGAADIPYTRFMSASPDGMNATGASDIRNYYDRLAGDRGAYVDPALMYLDQILIRSALGRYDDKVYRSWKPLWQLTETEQTELDAKKISMFGMMLDKGLVHDHVVEQVTRATMIDSPTFPGAEEAFEEAKSIPDPRDEEDEESTGMQAGGERKPANQPKAPAAEVKLRLVKDADGDEYLVDEEFLDKSGKFNESTINRYPAGSSKGGQFAPKGKTGTGGGSGPVKHGYAAAYSKAQKHYKEIQAKYAAEQTAAGKPSLETSKALIAANAAKKQALKDYYANKGTKAVAKTEAAKPAGLSVAEREAGIAAVKKEKSAALKEYKAHPTGSDEKKAALAVYNEKAALQKKMIEGLEKAKAGDTNSTTLSPKSIKSVKVAEPDPTFGMKGAESPASTQQYNPKSFSSDQKKEAVKKTLSENPMTVYSQTDASKIVAKGDKGQELVGGEKKFYEKYKAVVLGGTSLNQEAEASLTKKIADLKHSAAIDAVVKSHPHPTFGKSDVEKTIQKGLEGKPLGYNEQKLFNTYKETMNPGSTSPKVASHPSVAPIMKLDISSAFKDIEKNPEFAKAAEAFKSATTYDQKNTAHFGLVKGITAGIGGNLATPSVSQMTYVEFAEKWSSTEQSALKAYTGSAYSEINGALRNGKAASPTTQARINAIDKAFTKSVAKTDVVLMRGLAPAAVNKYIAEGNFAVGKTMIDKGYASTTSNYGTAKGFSQGGYQMVIRVKKGQAVAPLEQLSKYSGEKEFLLPRNTAFQIQHIDKTAKIVVVDVL